MTLKQIQLAELDPNEDRLIIDGREVTQMRVIGQIQEMTAASTGTVFTFQLDDGTAMAEAKLWIQAEAADGTTDYHDSVKSQWRQGIYVEVFATIKVQPKDNSRYLSAKRVNVITDYNLITHHFLQCIYAHLHATKSGNGTHLQQVVGGFQKFDPYANIAPKIEASTNNPYNNSSAPAGAHDAQTAVKNLCAQAPPKGFNIEQIAAKLPNFTSDEIEQALKVLFATGEVYTAADNHYKA